ncbi:bifunctional diaminohydroxyphosphoribosylaminopyrimidine deaminase/5-amino-6-(5-phosphoribosylamino)uracil reductase RibD [Uliginosibacterium sp. sgz301328]|uniref:bifunctional diaminohydroxyphosphoribosylaminopyrimidine deaminase/5-amino-6-(5-phosphoribosylamino)uracil reductase RibD n=1 Tax=Uliginosibacterium sp. sgz301328 TaxID=3243764 RepID=UPI00359D1E37
MSSHAFFMARALQLAERGLYTTTPNPRVGCVIVNDAGHVVGEGWHERAGEAHAEVHALRTAGEAARGATAYVTLEPCSHFGRTPPCSDALIAAGVRRVVAAMQDPNPLVAGRGLARLRDAGIAVEVGVMSEAAARLNEGFISRVTRGRPWLRLKLAATLDGKTALNNGQSQWITGEAARADGHHWRARSCAVLTGIGTVLADNPKLNVRSVETLRQPMKIVIDRQLETPIDAAVLDGAPTLIVTAQDDHRRWVPFEARGVEVIALPNADGRVDLAALMQELGKRGLNEVLTEAGARLNGALVAAGLADAAVIYLAPSFFGDAARGLLALPEMTDLTQRRAVHIDDCSRVGQDLRLLVRFERG